MDAAAAISTASPGLPTALLHAPPLLFGRIVGGCSGRVHLVHAPIVIHVRIGPFTMAACLSCSPASWRHSDIGAIVSGLLMVAVGFSAGSKRGTSRRRLLLGELDVYLVLPYIARRTVDLAPALVLSNAFVFGALFGFSESPGRFDVATSRSFA